MVMLFPTKINIILGVSTSNNAVISKINAEKQVALHSLTLTKICPNEHLSGYDFIHFLIPCHIIVPS